jgi:hypothetical protein
VRSARVARLRNLAATHAEGYGAIEQRHGASLKQLALSARASLRRNASRASGHRRVDSFNRSSNITQSVKLK